MRAAPVILGLAIVGLVVHALAYPFITDDAYISFRYAWNLATHGELTFNLGQRVEGYSNFLWTVFIAVALSLGIAPELAARVIGVAFAVLTLVTLFRFSHRRRGTSASTYDAFAPAFLALSPSFAAWCAGGLETQLFTFLLCWAMTTYLLGQQQPAGDRRSGVLFALAALTRPEGLWVAALTALHRLIVNLRSPQRRWLRRADVFWLGSFTLLVGLHLLWRYDYYGQLLPNTFYAKAASASYLTVMQQWGLPYLGDFVRDNALYLLLPLIPFLWLSPRRTPMAHDPSCPAIRWSYPVLVVVSWLGYVVWVGGDFMALGRFFVPVLPWIALLFQEGARGVGGWLTARQVRRPNLRWLSRALIVGGVVGLAANSVQINRTQLRQSARRTGIDSLGYLKTFTEDRLVIGRWLRERFPADTYVAVGGAGALVYASRFKALDTFGLTDAWIARHVPARGTRPGHAKWAPESYILREQPDLLCHRAKHQNAPYLPRAEEARYWRKRGYHWACFDPQGLDPRYYCCLQRKAGER